MGELTAVRRYKGRSSRYLDVAQRGAEFLGVSVEYAPHPNGIGYLIVRFVASGETSVSGFKHFSYREKAQFLLTSAPGQHEVFNGLRLNKVAIPVFKPAVQRHEVAAKGSEFDTWQTLAEWVTTQAIVEEFTPLIPPALLAEELRLLFTTKATEGVENVLELPDLTAPEHKQGPKPKKHEPEPDEDEDGDEDEDEDDDEDENGDDESKDWLN